MKYLSDLNGVALDTDIVLRPHDVDRVLSKPPNWPATHLVKEPLYFKHQDVFVKENIRVQKMEKSRKAVMPARGRHGQSALEPSQSLTATSVDKTSHTGTHGEKGKGNSRASSSSKSRRGLPRSPQGTKRPGTHGSKSPQRSQKRSQSPASTNNNKGSVNGPGSPPGSAAASRKSRGAGAGGATSPSRPTSRQQTPSRGSSRSGSAATPSRGPRKNKDGKTTKAPSKGADLGPTVTEEAAGKGGTSDQTRMEREIGGGIVSPLALLQADTGDMGEDNVSVTSTISSAGVSVHKAGEETISEVPIDDGVKEKQLTFTTTTTMNTATTDPETSRTRGGMTTITMNTATTDPETSRTRGGMTTITDTDANTHASTVSFTPRPPELEELIARTGKQNMLSLPAASRRIFLHQLILTNPPFVYSDLTLTLTLTSMCIGFIVPSRRPRLLDGVHVFPDRNRKIANLEKSFGLRRHKAEDLERMLAVKLCSYLRLQPYTGRPCLGLVHMSRKTEFASKIVMKSLWFRDLARQRPSAWINEVSHSTRYVSHRPAMTKMRVSLTNIEAMLQAPNCAGTNHNLSLMIPFVEVVQVLGQREPLLLSALLCELITNEFTSDVHNAIFDYVDYQLPGEGLSLQSLYKRLWRKPLYGEIPR